MKYIFLNLIILLSFETLKAQNAYEDLRDNDNSRKGFKKENVFLGGSLSLGFGSGSFNVGGNPEIGYSFSRFFDAGVVLNINYSSQRLYTDDGYNYYNSGKASSFNYGAGVFGRVYPIPFLFAQLQPEINWINYKHKDYNTDQRFSTTVNAASLIGGVGYSQRVVGEGSYFLMIGLDLLKDTYSPYLDGYGHPIPIIRGGFDVYLHPSRKARPVGSEL